MSDSLSIEKNTYVGHPARSRTSAISVPISAYFSPGSVLSRIPYDSFMFLGSSLEEERHVFLDLLRLLLSLDETQVIACLTNLCSVYVVCGTRNELAVQ